MLCCCVPVRLCGCVALWTGGHLVRVEDVTHGVDEGCEGCEEGEEGREHRVEQGLPAEAVGEGRVSEGEEDRAGQVDPAVPTGGAQVSRAGVRKVGGWRVGWTSVGVEEGRAALCNGSRLRRAVVRVVCPGAAYVLRKGITSAEPPGAVMTCTARSERAR